MSVQLLSYTVIAPVSVLSQSALIYGFLRVKQMKKHPEILIIFQCISQIILDLHWLTGIPDIHSSLSSSSGCQILGAFFVYCYYISWDYILFLSLEIFIKIRDPANCNYKFRLTIYHISAHASSAVIFLLLVLARKNNGNSVIGTCFVESGSVFELIVLLPVLIHMPVCLGICFYIFHLSRFNEIANRLKHHNFVVLAFTICWGMNGIAHGLNFQEFHIKNLHMLDEIIIGMGGPSGMLIFAARISQKGLFRKLIRAIFCCCSKKKEKVDYYYRFTTEEPMCWNQSEIKPEVNVSADYSDLFEGLTCNVIHKKAAIEILLGLTKYFKYCLNCGKNLSVNRKLKFDLNTVKAKNIQIKQYSVEAFNAIMQKSDIDYHGLILSLDIRDNLVGIESRCKSISGKSGAFFYYTANNEFIIKSIKKDEMVVLKSMMKDYTERVTGSNPSYLVRIYGVFRVSIGTQEPLFLCIMENLRRKFENPLIFDLKGSTYERRTTFTPHPNYHSMVRNGKVYKDLDFLNCFYDSAVGGDEGFGILKSLELDTELLEKYNLMDYSLLLFLEEISGPKQSFVQSTQIFHLGQLIGFVGIIDFLQDYSYKKKLENKLNSLKNHKKNKCSCIPPGQYRARFLELARKLFVSDSAHSSLINSLID